jgi:hypothetical protein
MNLCILKAAAESFGNNEIVDSPSRILGSCGESVAPPTVGTFEVRIKMSESIDESALKHFGEFASLLVGETGIATV